MNLLFCLKLCILELRRGASAKLHMICTLSIFQVFTALCLFQNYCPITLLKGTYQRDFFMVPVCLLLCQTIVTIVGAYASHSAWPLEWGPRMLKHFKCRSCLPELQHSSYQPARIPQFSTMCISVIKHRLTSGLQYQKKLILKHFAICQIESKQTW